MFRPPPAATVRSETPVPGGRRLALALGRGGEVPGVLLLPGSPRPVPGVLLLHGYSSDKGAMTEAVGLPLLGRGVASLAIDFPLHGARAVPGGFASLRNPLEAARLWRLAASEAALALRVLAARPEVDAARLALAGHSMGALLAVDLAGQERDVRAVVLAASGDLPAHLPLEAAVRALVDPVRAARRLGGRPLLMLNGRRDPTFPPEQAERLFAAATEPKELRWWDAGHVLPPAAVEDAAAWLAARLGEPAA